MSGLGQKVQKGAVWMVSFKLVERSIGLVSMIILARLLMPRDFGLVAMAGAVVGFLELLSALGFDMALIQNPSPERRHYDTAWTFNVLLGAGSAAVLLVLAIPVSQFFHEPRLAAVVAAMAAGPPISALQNIGVVAFRKELTFDREFKLLVAKKLAAFVVTVACALAFRSYWALVAGMVAGRLFGVVFSYVVHPYRPRLSLAARHELIDFSKWLLFNNCIDYLYRYSADWIVGNIAGAHALGIYSIGRQISTLPTTELIAPMNRAIFPGYAALAANQSTLREAFLKVLSVFALVALPAAVGIAATAEYLVGIALGPRWSEAVPLIQILAVYGAVTTLRTNTYYVQLALGNVRTYTAVTGMSVLVLLPLSAWWASTIGANGVGMAYLVVALLSLPLYYQAVIRKLSVKPRQLASRLWRPVVATAVMYLALRQALGYVSVDSTLGDVFELMGIVVLGILSYLIALLGLWYLAGRPPGSERFMVDNFVLVLQKKAS